MTSRRSDSGLDGILLIDKPQGWTSHDVVARARRITGQRRIGHTGTLDPMATGLLVLCLGRATRLVEYLSGHEKRYRGTVTLGRTTTTDDAEGDTLSESPVPAIPAELLDEVLSAFRGEVRQRPPAYSALKVGGRRAYALARAGAAPELAERTVTVSELEGRLISPTEIALEVRCSAGTYVRSLARDIGKRLGCGGHLSALRREAAGHFRVDESASLEELETAVDRGLLEDLLMPPDEGILEFEAAILEVPGATVVANGGPWTAQSGALRVCERVRVYSADGTFVAVGTVSSLGEIRASKVFERHKSAES